MTLRTIAGMMSLMAAASIAGSAFAQQAAAPAANLTFFGDFRFRHDQVSAEGAKQRDRERIRLRFGATATVNPRATITVVAATGTTDDPTSSNQDLSGGFSDKPLWIEQAYFTCAVPVEGLSLLGGKMKPPFYSAGKSQLLWDADLNVEGLAARYSRKAGETDIFASAAFLPVQERSTDDDSHLVGGQAGAKRTFGGLNATAGAGIFLATNTKGFATFYDTTESFGNSVDVAGKYRYDYREVELFAEATLPKVVIPLSFAVDYVQNIAADVTENHGYFIGVTAGKTLPGSLAGRFYYKHLEKDAVIGVFGEGDFAGGGTDNRGMVFGLDYQAAKNASLNATFFLNETDADGGTDYNRLQIETNFKF